MFTWFKRRVDPEYELLWQMGRLQTLINAIVVEMRKERGKPLFHYWERKWNEAVLLYMDFEWLFHPENDEGFRRENL